MKIGDIVTRKSYNKDIIFKIVGFGIDNKNEKIAILKGVAFRVIADAYLEDLEVVKVSDIKQILIDPTVENLIYKSVRSAQDREKKMNRAVPKLQANPNVYGIPGKVLQIDGDKEYLKICLDVYTELGIPAVGVAIPEENQYKEIINLLEKHNPDILVITGHDALTSRKGNITDLNNYRNSLNFIKAVKQARKWEPNLDNLVIFAGACQSNYEQLIRAGANYASSPGRIMIHALDPVFVVEKIACSRIDTIVPIEEVIEQTVTGLKGIGDTIKKFFNSQVTGESTIKPQYVGTGVIVTEPSYKHYIIEDLDDWNGAMCVEDGLYCASETKVSLSATMIKSVSGQTIGEEGLFNLCLKGSGKVVLECDVPQEELITIDLHNDTLKIDGSFAIAWSENLDFTVERSGKTLIGSAMSGEGLVNVYRGTGRVLIKPQI